MKISKSDLRQIIKEEANRYVHSKKLMDRKKEILNQLNEMYAGDKETLSAIISENEQLEEGLMDLVRGAKDIILKYKDGLHNMLDMKKEKLADKISKELSEEELSEIDKDVVGKVLMRIGVPTTLIGILAPIVMQYVNMSGSVNYDFNLMVSEGSISILLAGAILSAVGFIIKPFKEDKV
jgi:transcriptional regulator of heat shock response